MRSNPRTVDPEGFRTRLAVVLLACVFASVVAVGAAAVAAFDRAVGPELSNRTRLIGVIVRAEVQRAAEAGIPLNSIAGLDRYLSETLEKFREVERISVATSSGQSVAVVERRDAAPILPRADRGEAIAARQATFVLPVIDGNRLVGEIHVDISPRFMQTRMRDVFLGVMVLSLVATLVALELALAIAATSVGKPLERVLQLVREQCEGDFRRRIRLAGVGGLRRAALRLNDHAEDLATRLRALPEAARARVPSTLDAKLATRRPSLLRLSDVGDIRLAMFIFVFATEIAAAFLPLYARQAERPAWLPPELASAAPLAAFLVVAALIAPFGGTLASRFGARRLFLAAVPLGVLALGGMAASTTVVGVMIWRGVTAMSYLLATIACQVYAIRAAGEGSGARAFGAYNAVIYGGIFCGAAMGGVIAGRFGFEAALVCGSAIALAAGALGFSSLRGDAGDAVGAGGAQIAGLKSRRVFGLRFVALLLGVTVPMNAATAIFVWYLAPLILAGSGSGPAEIARVVMLYYLATVVFGPMVARHADGRTGQVALVALGAAGSGAALLSLTVWDGFWGVVSAVAGLGLGHAMMRAPSYSLAVRITRGSGRALSALRGIERLGAFAGLAASALLLGDVGALASVRALGILVLCGVVLYLVVEGARQEWANPKEGR
jgi:hypothetical protein